jgi:hypothetical protein
MGLTPYGAVPSFQLKSQGMKTNYRKRSLTFGEFVVSVYDVCGTRQARGVIRLAIEAHLIEFPGQRRFVVPEDFDEPANATASGRKLRPRGLVQAANPMHSKIRFRTNLECKR